MPNRPLHGYVDPTKQLSLTFVMFVSVLLVASSGIIGCSSNQSRVYPPGYAADAGAAAIKAYDKDGDNELGGAELDAVPGLKLALQQVDSDGNGKLSAQEIEARIQSWRDSRVGEMTVPVQVTLDGEALAEATVVFEPETFLGPGVRPASVKLESNGTGNVSMAAEHLADPKYPGIAAAWYKVRVTSDSKDIPARYNSQSTLGCEVCLDAAWRNRDGFVAFRLNSK